MRYVTLYKPICYVATLAAAAVFIPSTPALAQTLTLAEAFARADQSAYSNRMAEGETRARSGDKTSALAGILPTLRAEGGYTRTTDPLGTFGTILRQRAVTLSRSDRAVLFRGAAGSV